MEGYEHVQRVRSRGLKTADLSYQGGRPNIRPTDKLKRPPSRLSNPIECAGRQQVLRERTGGCSPDEYDSPLRGKDSFAFYRSRDSLTDALSR